MPPGSDRVRADAGVNQEEAKRHARAHHHQGHHRKDYTRDDSVYEAPRQAAPEPAKKK